MSVRITLTDDAFPLREISLTFSDSGSSTIRSMGRAGLNTVTSG
jgi:hypothetical protein